MFKDWKQEGTLVVRGEKIAPKKEPFKFEEIKNACDSKNKNKILMLSDPKDKSCCLLLMAAGKAVFKCLSITVEKGYLKHNLICPYNISLQEHFFME